MTPTNTIKRLEMYIKYWEKSVDVQKSLNRLVQIDYTVRVQSLTGFNEG